MAHSARRSHRRRSSHGRFVPSLAAPMIASIAVVALTLMLIGTDLAGNMMVRAANNPTPTPAGRLIDGPFIPIEIATEVPTREVSTRIPPTRDVPVFGVPTEPLATEEVIPTEEPTEIIATEVLPLTQGNAVQVIKRYCPEGMAHDLSMQTYVSECAPGAAEFTLTDGVGSYTQISADDGFIQWDGVEPPYQGQFQIQETLPDGYGDPVVFCGGFDGFPAAVPAPNGLVSIPSPVEPFTWQCYFFNLGTPTDDPGDGTIGVRKYYCLEGLDTGLTLDAYIASCTEPLQDTTFTLVDGLGSHEQSTNPDIGGVLWDDVTIGQEGELQLTESIPDGYGEPVVFCGQEGSQPVLMPSANGFVIPQPSAVPFSYLCHWFNIPDPDGSQNEIALWKYYCPEGTDPGLSLDEYKALCTELHDTGFTLVDGTGDLLEVTDPSGYAQWDGVTIGQEGELQLIENLPDGYSDPVVFCGDPDEQLGLMSSANGFVVPTLASASFVYLCYWFNIPIPEDDGNAIELWKHYCPAGTSDALTIADYMTICTEPVPPTTFTLTDPDGAYPMTTDANGYTRWLDVSTTAGQVAIAEKLLPGYGTPQVFCEYSGQQPEQVPATNGYLHLSLVSDEFRLLCQVFNIPTDLTSSLTIVKYTCPVGYDLFAPGANPGFDCQTLTDGIPFVLDDGMPGLDIGGLTGDGGSGVVSFADVKPGSYTVEEIVPPGMGDPFVLKCDGDVPQLQPYPLWQGNNLPITLNPGQAVTCFWYNVPAPDPNTGTLTVIKYACTTKVFVSDLECQVYEGGQTMDLLEWDGVQWNVNATATTDAFGRIVWTNLPIGHYLLAEQGTTWCHLSSSALLGNDGSFNLNQQGGMNPTVNVYNCGYDPETPEGTPTDWPNTGVGDTHSSMRVDASDERRIPPVEGGEPATPAANQCLNADDPLATSGDDDCPRGGVPSTIRIDAIDVNAPVEVKETVGGQMQQPTGETAVAWYKESPRLGETGNMLFAGHLNWWGIPEAVFFRLGDLQEGDEIMVTDASGAEWTYRVTWVRQDDTFSPPSADVVGPTAQPSITLITCGGEWNAATGLYDKRTVVRAELVSGPGMV